MAWHETLTMGVAPGDPDNPRTVARIAMAEFEARRAPFVLMYNRRRVLVGASTTENEILFELMFPPKRATT